MTLRALAARLVAREVSAVETTRAALDCIAVLDPHYRAFLTVGAEQALAEARARDEASAPLGPLHGVPVAIKDLADSAGMRTTYGSLLYRDHVPTRDDALVARLRAAGAVIVGKTMTPEFGFGAICANKLGGPTRNPFDPALTSGGSSGGSAVAVATGMVPLAHGSDFGGSVRTPASFCGVVAMRPTPGRLANPGRALALDMMATSGFIARAVDDLALALEATAGADPLDPLSERDFPEAGDDAGPLRIAASEDLGVARVSERVRAPFRAAVACIAERLAPVTAAHPDCAGAIDAFHVLRPALIRNSYGRLRDRHGDALTETVRWWIDRGDAISAADFLAAEVERGALYRRFVRFFETHDVLVLPAASVLPWPNTIADVLEIDGMPLGTIMDYLEITFVVSMTGCPVICLPAARSPEGLPVGIQLVAAPGRDADLLRIAGRFERDCGFAHVPPPAPALPPR